MKNQTPEPPSAKSQAGLFRRTLTGNRTSTCEGSLSKLASNPSAPPGGAHSAGRQGRAGARDGWLSTPATQTKPQVGGEKPPGQAEPCASPRRGDVASRRFPTARFRNQGRVRGGAKGIRRRFAEGSQGLRKVLHGVTAGTGGSEGTPPGWRRL